MVGLTSKKYLRLTPKELWLPGPAWSRTDTVVRLAEIVDVAFEMVHKQRFLVIQHRGGR